jgi:polysaccharide biosynthesis transport protein
MAQYELNLRDYWQIVRKQRRTVLLMAVLVALAAFGLSQLLKPPPLYEATASVKFERSSNVAGLFLETVTISYSDNIASQVEVIKSYPVMEAAARQAGLLAPELTSEQVRRDPQLLQVVLGLQRRVEAEREGITNIIRISVTAHQADEAELLANSVVAAYRGKNIEDRNHQVRSAIDFIQAQLAMVEMQLRESEQELEEFKVSEGIVQLDAEAQAALNMLARAEIEYDEITRALKEMDDQIVTLESQGALTDDLVVPKGSSIRIFTENAAAQIFTLNSRLMDLQQERDTLLIMYEPGHPQVDELLQKIRVVREEMLRELQAKRSTYQGREQLLASRLIELRGQYQSAPEKALRLARLHREVAINNDIYSLLKTRHQEALIKGAEKIIEVTPIQPAFATSVPINAPHTLINVLAGALIGCLTGLIIGFLRESFDTSLGTIEDVESFLGLPVLGVLPHAGDDVVTHTTETVTHAHMDSAESANGWITRIAGWVGWTNRSQGLRSQRKRAVSEHRQRSAADLATLYSPKSALAESYRSLRTNLLFTSLGQPFKVVQFTGVGIGEGKTSVVVNLAITIAQAGKRVLVIDADLRRPAIHQIFGIDKSPGLTELLLGNKTFGEVCRSLPDLLLGRFQVEDVMKLPGIDKLNIITSGFLPPNPSECLNSDRFDEIMEELKSEYDMIIFDTPPILPVADSVIIGRKTDATMLVYQVGDIPRLALRRAKLILEQAHVKVIGTVLNNIRAEITMDSYQLHYHYPYFSSATQESGKSETPKTQDRLAHPTV